MISSSKAKRLGVRQFWTTVELDTQWEPYVVAAWCMLDDSPKRFFIRSRSGNRIIQFEDVGDSVQFALAFDHFAFYHNMIETIKKGGKQYPTYVHTTSSDYVANKAQHVVSLYKKLA